MAGRWRQFDIQELAEDFSHFPEVRHDLVAHLRSRIVGGSYDHALDAKLDLVVDRMLADLVP